MEQELEYKSQFKAVEESGQMASSAVGSIIVLIVGVSITVLMLIFTGALSGQTWQLVEPNIDAITNTTIKESVKSSVVSGFEALEQTGGYLPLIVLAVITALIIGIVLSFGGLSQGARGGNVL